MTDDIRSYRLEGDRSWTLAVEDVDRCLREALASNARRVLIDVRGLTGFASPTSRRAQA